MKSEKRIEFYTAYDRSHPDPSQDCDIHGVDIAFYVEFEMRMVTK